MSNDWGAKALAMVLPNAASMAGCMLTGECALLKCCKGKESAPCPTTCSCPIPMVAWHLGLLAGNASCGYASYLIWKELGGFGTREHSAFALFVLSSTAHPILMKKCEKWGCKPALINCVCGVGLAACTTQLFMKVNSDAGYFMIPGVVLALMCAACTFSHAKKSGGSCCPSGSCCSSGSCCMK